MATHDLITLAEAKAALNVTSTTHDNEITQFVTAVSARIDDLCGPGVYRTVDDTFSGGSSMVRPSTTPVSSVTSVVEYLNTSSTELAAETNEAKPADGYLLDVEWTHNVRIWRRASGADSLFPAGRRNIEVSYVAGRFATTSAVSPKFKQAASLMLQHLWRPSAGAWSRAPQFADAVDQPTQMSTVAPWAVPKAVKELLADELRPPAGA